MKGRPPSSTLFPSPTLFGSPRAAAGVAPAAGGEQESCGHRRAEETAGRPGRSGAGGHRWPSWWVRRSEEHTSELQTRQYLVCRLLLEKKKLPSNVRCPLP